MTCPDGCVTGASNAGAQPVERTTRIRLRVEYVLAALVVAAILTLASTAHAGGCHSRSCELRVHSKKCSQRNVTACIQHAALRYRQPLSDMLRVARCESSLDPYNTYAGHYGLYQFLPSTWATTPYRHRWIFSARYQALATAWMWSVGRRGEWACT